MNQIDGSYLRCEIIVLEMFCILQLFKHTNAEKRNVLKHQSKSNMGMYVMCQIRYYWDAADKILKVVYCTRLASDVLIIEK